MIGFKSTGVRGNMRIEAVIVCKDYSDFLAHSLPENTEHFDHIVVVTHHSDKATQAVCSKYSIECIQAHVFDEDGDRFNKGRAVNVGLAHLHNPDWIVHLDADIVLPKSFRRMLASHKLNTNNLYGCDRQNVFGFEKWLKLLDSLNPHYKDFWFVEPSAEHPVGARIVHREHGYVPIGYFQMWHKSQHKKYPIYEGTAEHSDVLFAIQWHRNQRVLLPEIVVYHLDSALQRHSMGKNWYGRKSSAFCPCHDGFLPESLKYKGCHHHHHKHHHHPHPYCPHHKGEKK